MSSGLSKQEPYELSTNEVGMKENCCVVDLAHLCTSMGDVGQRCTIVHILVHIRAK